MESLEKIMVETSHGSVQIATDFHVSQKTKRHLRALVRDTIDEAKPVEELQEYIKKLTPTAGTPRGALRGYMQSRGWSQRTLAKKAGISPAHISEMVNGKRPIGPVIAKKIAGALGVNYKRFL